MKLNGTHEPLVYAEGINIFGYYVFTIKKNKRILIDLCNYVGKEDNTIAISEVWTERYR
jgi:hypothetical protein